MTFLVIIAALIYIIALGATFAAGIGFLWLRPHRAKHFFSYSHKDAGIAKRVVSALAKYKLRIWVDLGVLIPTDRLEAELSYRIKKGAVLILLASQNSRSSQWVQFELREARKTMDRRLTKWRDLVILAIDDAGLELYQEFAAMRDERMRTYYYSNSRMRNRSASEREDFETKARKFVSFVDFIPPIRRAVVWDVSLIDLRTVGSVELLADHLRQNSRLFKEPTVPFLAKLLKASMIYIFCLWLLILLFAGYLLIILLNRANGLS